MPPARAPFPIGTTTAPSGRSSCSTDLVGDRAVCLVLDRLGAVLEERQLPTARVGPGGVLGLVDVCAAEPDVGAEPLEVRELRRCSTRSGAKTIARHAEVPCRPRSGCAVVPGRRSDEAGRALLPVMPGHGERATPLERAELVCVLALEPDVAALRELGGAGSRGVVTARERGLDAASDPDLHPPDSTARRGAGVRCCWPWRPSSCS